MMKVQARMLVPAWKRLRAAQALSSVSWTRSSARSRLPGQRAAEGAQMRDDLRQLILELVVGQRHRLGARLVIAIC